MLPCSWGTGICEATKKARGPSLGRTQPHCGGNMTQVPNPNSRGPPPGAAAENTWGNPAGPQLVLPSHQLEAHSLQGPARSILRFARYRPWYSCRKNGGSFAFSREGQARCCSWAAYPFCCTHMTAIPTNLVKPDNIICKQC